MWLLFVSTLGLAAVAAVPFNPERIVGGSVTNIASYPFGVAILFYQGTRFVQECGGTILNNRSILSAAHCFMPNHYANVRSRVGSTYAHSGGVVHNTRTIIIHPNYVRATLDSDLAVVRVTNAFTFNNNVRAGAIAGANYNIPDNTPVWAIGWGRIDEFGPMSEELRHVQVWTVNQAVCRSRYARYELTLTDNMLCSGWLDVGGRDQCQGDSGGPLLHNNVVVGVCSWGLGCALPHLPGVNVRVPRFTSWIQSNA